MRQQLLRGDPSGRDASSEHRKIRDAFSSVKSHAVSLGGPSSSTSGYSLMASYVFCWRASIYRLVWLDILVWLVLYYALNLVYRFVMDNDQKLMFMNLVEQVNEWGGKIPVTFLLGFFVSNVMSRWWSIYMSIPRMTGPATTLISCLVSDSRPEAAAKYRMAIGRYLNVAWVLGLSTICGSLQQRLDTVRGLIAKFGRRLELVDEKALNVELQEQPQDELDEMLQRCLAADADPQHKSLELLAVVNCDPVVRQHCGRLLTLPEMRVFLRRAEEVGPSYKPEWFIPVHWALALTHRAAAEGFIADSLLLLNLQEEIRAWSAKIRLLLNYAKRHLPLVYAQVAIIAVYTVYLTDVISRQLLDQKEAFGRKARGYYIDYFIPILGIVHVVFMIGWFKVALVLMDPFGVDEEDFPFSAIFNGNMKVVKEQCGDSRSWLPPKLLADGEESDDEQPLAELSEALDAAEPGFRQFEQFADD